MTTAVETPDLLGQSIKAYYDALAVAAPLGVSWVAQRAQLDELIALHPTYAAGVLDRITRSQHSPL